MVMCLPICRRRSSKSSTAALGIGYLCGSTVKYVHLSSHKQWSQRSDYMNHRSYLKWKADWPLAHRIIGTLMPKGLLELFTSDDDIG